MLSKDGKDKQTSIHFDIFNYVSASKLRFQFSKSLKVTT